MMLNLLPWQAAGLDGRVQKILTWRWKEVPVELGRQAVTCSQVTEGKDDNSVGSLLCEYSRIACSSSFQADSLVTGGFILLWAF